MTVFRFRPVEVSGQIQVFVSSRSAKEGEFEVRGHLLLPRDEWQALRARLVGVGVGDLEPIQITVPHP